MKNLNKILMESNNGVPIKNGKHTTNREHGLKCTSTEVTKLKRKLKI